MSKAKAYETIPYGPKGLPAWSASLLIVIPVAQKLADLSMPPWPEALWKLAVVAAAGNIVAVVLDPVDSWLSLIARAVIFWGFMWKWFDVDLFGAVIIAGVSWVLRWAVGIVVMGLIASAF